MERAVRLELRRALRSLQSKKKVDIPETARGFLNTPSSPTARKNGG